MNGVVAPVDLLEEVLTLRLPPWEDQRLQDLMDRNNNGLLPPAERDDLLALAEWSEKSSLVNARVLHLLGCTP
jgi:hypothetical protein